MNSYIRRFVFLLAGIALCLSCSREGVPEQGGVPEGEPVEVTLHFGASSPVEILTKSTLGERPENMVYNLYVFIFDMAGGGKKIYGQYFDYSNLSTSGSSTLPEWWEVKNNEINSVTGEVQTSGVIHLHTISKPQCKVVAVTNIDAEMVNISPQQLSSVVTYEDLFSQKARLNQNITSRSGYFPMSGELDGVDTGNQSLWGSLSLKRLDAKIKFRVYVDPSLQADGETPVSPIAEFEPLKWQIVNLPTKAYVLERGAYKEGQLTLEEQLALEDASVSAGDFFNQGETNFETEELTSYNYAGTTMRKKLIHGFSFYMMENRKAVKDPVNPPMCYADREKQQKTDATLAGGIAHVTNGSFVHPDDRSTYVVITGRLVMDNVAYASSEGATLSGEVQYVVHLGDWSGGKWKDFNVFRNHTYTYDIIVRDVNDIKVEVTNNYEGATLEEKLAEPEPGASGTVSIALEEIYTSDAHYSSHVIDFHAKHIDADKVTWNVKTPFNPSGAGPVITNGVEVTTGIDYEWVEFRLNDKDDNGVYYSDRRQVYKPRTGTYADGKTMNVSALVAYLKDQKRRRDQGLSNDFDTTPDEDGGPKISVTAFVNEYYYEKNPITGDYQKDLWKKFVNQPARSMYILSQTQVSADGESQVLGSSFTIRQKSIQSIYNINHPGLESAWGSEHTDDDLERGLEVYDKSGSGNRGNNSKTNGRLNTLKEWSLVNPDGSNRVLGDYTEEDAYWSHYMDLSADNETPIMLPNYRYLRYSCMSRNRDNNGNGVIDEDEVRWYMGAHSQLIGLFMGSYGIEGDARLYQRNAQERASTDKYIWRQHVIASTIFQGKTNSSASPCVLWGEEGLSAGEPSGSRSWAGGLDKFSTRCVRNLGYDPASGGDITYAHSDVEPESYVQTRRLKSGAEYSGNYDADVYYEFDVSRLNEASLRYYTDRELVHHDENSEPACLYRHFVFAPVAEGRSVGQNIRRLNETLNANIGTNPYCPEGYRLPNVRELAVLHEFISSKDLRGFFPGSVGSRTYWSFGVIGDDYLSTRGVENRYGWAASYDKVYMLKDNENVAVARCVKDVKQ